MVNFSRKATIDMATIKPTSKLSLKLTCLKACNNNVKEATELYSYITDGLELPDVDPIMPTTLDQIKNGADGLFGWIMDHKDTLVQGYEIVRGMTAKATTPLNNIPPIPNI